MRFVLTLITTLILAASAGASETETLSAGALLDRVITRPGGSSQLCDLRPFRGHPSPSMIQLYAPGMWGQFHLSNADRSDLTAQRAGVVSDLVARLSRVDPFREAPRREASLNPTGGGGLIRGIGPNPDALSALFLEVVLAVNAVEVLPQLLRIEGEIDAAIVAAEAGSNPLAEVDFDAGYSYYANPKPMADGDAPLTPGQVARLKQRITADAKRVRIELLSVMLRLLRAQRYPPLLASSIERTYGDALLAGYQMSTYRSITSPAEAVAQGKPWIRFDPIHNVPITSVDARILLTPELRTEIRALAERFTADVPPSQWLHDSPSASAR